MRLPRFEHMKPDSLAEGLAVLQEKAGRAQVLAGGTDLLVNMKYGVVRPETVVSLGSLEELSTVAESPDGDIRIGACCTLSDLADRSLIAEKLPVLKRAIASVASRHLRNMGTIGGNICLAARCWYYNQSKLWRDARELCYRTGGSVCHAISGSDRCHAVNSSDTAPMLAALDASVTIANTDGERHVPIRQFFRDDGHRHTVLGSGDVVVSLTVPAAAVQGRGAFVKLSVRRGIDFAMANIGAWCSGGTRPAEMRLVLNAIASRPLELQKAPQIIQERGFSPEAIEAAAEASRSELGTLTNLFTSAGYKRQIAQVLVKRALTQLNEQ